MPDEERDPIEGAPFDLSIRDLDGTRFVTVTGEIDLAVAETLAEALKAPHLLVDMSGVSFIDSSGTRCLLTALEQSDSLVLRRSSDVDRLLELSGVADLFPAPE